MAKTAAFPCGRGGRPSVDQAFVPGGPRKSVVSCGNGLWVVGCALLGCEWVGDGRVVPGLGGGGGGGGAGCALG
jgi:hypothetical protein